MITNCEISILLQSKSEITCLAYSTAPSGSLIINFEISINNFLVLIMSNVYDNHKDLSIITCALEFFEDTCSSC